MKPCVCVRSGPRVLAPSRHLKFAPAGAPVFDWSGMNHYVYHPVFITARWNPHRSQSVVIVQVGVFRATRILNQRAFDALPFFSGTET